MSKKFLQSLAGRLSFAISCIYGARFYTRCIFDTIGRVRCPWHRTRVARDMRADIVSWINCLKVFNSFTPILDRRPQTPIYIDACDKALGACFQDEFVYTPLRAVPAWENLHINYKGVVALEPAINQWAPLLTNKKVIIHSDNRCAVSIINRGSCKHPVVMQALRRIFWLSVMYNFRISCVYIEGVRNIYADAVSRLHEPSNPLQALNLHPVWFPPQAPYSY